MPTSPYRDADVARRMFATPFAVEFAYPTSTIAARLGHSKAGCYYVSQVNGDRPRVPVSEGYASRAAASQFLAVAMAETPCAHTTCDETHKCAVCGSALAECAPRIQVEAVRSL